MSERRASQPTEPQEAPALSSDSLEASPRDSDLPAVRANTPPAATRSLLPPTVVAFIGICYLAWIVQPNYTIGHLGIYLLLAVIAAFAWNSFTKR